MKKISALLLAILLLFTIIQPLLPNQYGPNTINNNPAIWLWSHNRWKRTWEGYQKYLKYMEEKRQRASKSS